MNLAKHVLANRLNIYNKMRRYKYIGETDESTTNGKIYNVKKDGTFIDDTNTECCLGNDFEKYFELESILNNNQLATMFLEENYCTKPDIDNPYKLYWKEDVVDAMVRFLDANI